MSSVTLNSSEGHTSTSAPRAYGFFGVIGFQLIKSSISRLLPAVLEVGTSTGAHALFGFLVVHKRYYLFQKARPQDPLSRNVDMLSTGICGTASISYVTKSHTSRQVYMCILGGLNLSSSQPSSWCFQTETTKRARFTSSSEPWLLPWRQEPLQLVQEVWYPYLVQGHPWWVGLVLRKQHRQ
ncbi:hypothetical protein BD769DRAFT_1452342 [Suillus cothurnatus]|nr:hypothetical protein BD769DRAFT_1452342 [Suillus cothurnatus]